MIISVEGNIGSGKTKFIELFSKYLKEETNLSNKFIFLSEPVDEWINTKNQNNENILEVFYKDRKRWSYTFQMNAFITKSKLLMDNLKSHSNKIIVSERSVLTDKFIFAKSCLDDGSMDKLEENLYDKWFDWLTDEFTIIPELIIYLQASPDISYQRMKKRGRIEENDVSLDYIKKISDYHEKWLGENSSKHILILNVDLDFENNSIRLNQMIKDILKFISLNKKFRERLCSSNKLCRQVFL